MQGGSRSRQETESVQGRDEADGANQVMIITIIIIFKMVTIIIIMIIIVTIIIRMGLAGYDPAEEDMRGIFMAKGPGEKRNEKTKCSMSRHLLDGST